MRYDEALSTLAELEDIGWKVRLCPMDTQRALNFLVRKARLPGGQLEQAREILRDIELLLPHNESPVPEGELPDAGGDGLYQYRAEPHHQNLLGGIRGVLPPTLVASSYGMNFEVYAGTEVELRLPRRDYLYDPRGPGTVSVL